MKDDKVFIKHILDEVNYILKKTSKITFSQLEKDETLKRALLRSLEIIGGATKNLSNDFKNKNSIIKWKEIAGLRDKLIHFYFGVKWDIVWSVFKNKIPELKTKIETILKDLEK